MLDEIWKILEKEKKSAQFELKLMSVMKPGWKGMLKPIKGNTTTRKVNFLSWLAP